MVAVHITSRKIICFSDKDRDEAGFFVKANKRSELISKLIMIGIPIGVGGPEVLLSLASIGISMYLFGEIRENILFRPYQLRLFFYSFYSFTPSPFIPVSIDKPVIWTFSLPWDQNTFAGWFGEHLVSHTIYISYCTINGAILSLFIGFCEYLHAFRNHFEASITKINDINGNKAANVLTTRIKMKSVLCEVIEFHNSIKDFFIETTELHSIFILLEMLSSMIFLSCGLFQLDLVRFEWMKNCGTFLYIFSRRISETLVSTFQSRFLQF